MEETIIKIIGEEEMYTWLCQCKNCDEDFMCQHPKFCPNCGEKIAGYEYGKTKCFGDVDLSVL